jgi:hypothetical protein
MLTIDKGYYDYDYEYYKPKKLPDKVEIWSDDMVQKLLMGAMIPGTNKRVFDEPIETSEEDMQQIMIKERSNNGR